MTSVAPGDFEEAVPRLLWTRVAIGYTASNSVAARNV
jgi:hypothetical protein